MRFSFGLVLLLTAMSATSTAQSQFAGTWQTRTYRTTGKSAVTVKIVEDKKQISGTVVLVNPPDGSEFESQILNPKVNGNLLEFETLLNTDRFYWTLTLKKTGSSRGFLRGSFHEMLIDEAVVRRR